MTKLWKNRIPVKLSLYATQDRLQTEVNLKKREIGKDIKSDIYVGE